MTQPKKPSNGTIEWWCNKIVCLTKSSEINRTVLSFFLLTKTNCAKVINLKERRNKLEEEEEEKWKILLTLFRCWNLMLTIAPFNLFLFLLVLFNLHFFFFIIRVSILFMFIIQINQFIFLFSVFNYKKCISCLPCWVYFI